jgi:hypothetical protein
MHKMQIEQSGSFVGKLAFALAEDGAGERIGVRNYVTEPNIMILAVEAEEPGKKGQWYKRMNREEVVRMARFFAKAASKMDD